MRHNLILTLLLLSAILVGCSTKSTNEKKVISTDIIKNPVSASGNFDTKDLPIIQFEKTEHDFGIIVQGEKVTYTFKFKNIGNRDLIIKDASATCGCTVPKYNREPISPGDEGEIEVIFDSNNRTGRQHKTITIWTNCQPNQTKLQIISEIVVLNK